MAGRLDVDAVIDEVPPSLMAEWRVWHMLRPWDAAETYALLKGQYERPAWLEDIMEQATERERKASRGKRRLSMTKRAILRAARKVKSFFGWTWP